MMLVAASGIGVGLMVISFYLNYPSLPVLLSSLVPNIEEQPLWLYLILGSPSVLLAMSIWASAVVVAVIFYFPEYVSLFLLKEMR
jgi:hypothetical protein